MARGRAPGRTVFITGGSSGIGLGLARAFHARGATVIIGGRDLAALEAAAAQTPGMQVAVIDVTDLASIQRCADALAQCHPDLDTLINNAGLQRVPDFAAATPVADEVITGEIDTNLTGAIRVANAFLPLLKRQPAARLVNVTSALAYVPLTLAPVYSATKAGLQAYTRALRDQLRDTNVQVVELAPPQVKTNLHRGQDASRTRRAMPLAQFTAAAMRALDSGRDELPIGLAKAARLGARVAPEGFRRLLNRVAR